MRIFLAALWVSLSLLLAGPAAAANLANDQRLDLLFKALKTAQSESEGLAIERQIVSIWLQSGEPKIDLQMEWAIDAMEAGAYDLALDYLNSIILNKPDYAEGWNKRATLYYMMGRHEDSLRDIAETLTREPRHFGAIAGRGMVELELGDEEAALAAFREALAIDPQLTNIQLAIYTLESRLKQRKI